MIEIDGTVQATIEPAMDATGDITPTHNTFKIYNQTGQLVYQTNYEATLYRNIYETERMTSVSINVVADETSISDWDLFYSTVDACKMANQPHTNIVNEK